MKNISELDLTIIVLNYNSGDHLVKCIEAARLGAKHLRHEFTVVDNASSDGSLDHAKGALEMQGGIRWLLNAENLGFARGNNPAIQGSRGRWILLLNPDTRVEEESILLMVRSADRQPNVGIVGGKLLYPDGRFQWACRRKIPTPRTALARLVGKASHYNYPEDPDLEMDVEAVSGSFMLAKRRLFEQIGFLDESFFMYGEDLDFCLRARQAGWGVRYQPRAVAVHAKGESSRLGSRKALYEFYRAMWVFYRKHYAAEQSPLVTLAVYFGVVLLGVWGFALYPFRSDKRVGFRYS